jgi:exosome complex component RRP46
MTEVAAETSVLNRVDGSATFQAGETKVIVSVSGPIEAKLRQELPTTGVIELVIRADVGVSDTREKLMEDKIKAALYPVINGSLYPRQLIQITAQVLDAGEGEEYTSNEISAILNASYLALIDANVALNASFSCASFAIDREGHISVTPSKDDLYHSKSSHVVSYEIKNGKATRVLLSDSIGTFTEQQLLKVLDNAALETEKFHQVFRKTIQTKIEKDFIWKY